MPGYAPISYEQSPGRLLNGKIACNAFASFTAGQNGADTTEDVLQSFTLPALGLTVENVSSTDSFLYQNGSLLKLRAWGVTANNADAKTLKLYHGTTSFTVSLTTSTAAAWLAELELMRVSVTAQIARFLCIHGTSILACSQLTNGADNLANSLIAKVTGTAGTGNAGDIICNGAVVELWP